MLVIEAKPKFACTFGSLSDKVSAAFKFGTCGVGAIILVAPSISIEVPIAVAIGCTKAPKVNPAIVVPAPKEVNKPPTTILFALEL